MYLSYQSVSCQENALQIAIVFVLMLIYAFFTWLSPQAFLSYSISKSLMATTLYFALLTIPLILVIVAKEIDISTTSVMASGTAVFTVVHMATHNILQGVICCLATGVFAGLLNCRRHRGNFGCLTSYPAQTVDLNIKEAYETTR